MSARHSAAGLAALLVAASCASFGQGGGEADDSGVAHDRGAVVLTGHALEDGAGTVLGAMAGKVPNFRIQHTGSGCPSITLRSYVSYVGLANPHVYVDGTRATDTCVLESLRSSDVQRVEVYPQGFTRRPGYGTHAPGLILVFMRTG